MEERGSKNFDKLLDSSSGSHLIFSQLLLLLEINHLCLSIVELYVVYLDPTQAVPFPLTLYKTNEESYLLINFE
jgi:hypothetical protein